MFKKLKDFKVNFALIAFLAFAIKMILIDPSFADGIVIAVLGAVYGYTRHLERFQVYNLDQEVANDLREVKTALSKLNLANSIQKKDGNKYF